MASSHPPASSSFRSFAGRGVGPLWWVIFLLLGWMGDAWDDKRIDPYLWIGCGRGGTMNVTYIPDQTSFFIPPLLKQNINFEAKLNFDPDDEDVTLRINSTALGYAETQDEGNYRYFLFGGDSSSDCGAWGSPARFEEIFTLTMSVPTRYNTLMKRFDIQFTSVNTRPRCYNFSVYVQQENCRSSFSTSNIPATITNLSSTYGRCSSFNDVDYCGPRLNWWTDNVVKNGRGQVAWNSDWTLTPINNNNDGVWTNLGPGKGFSVSSDSDDIAERLQVIDLVGLGYDPVFLDTHPPALFVATVKPTTNGVSGSVDQYSYQIRLSGTRDFANYFGFITNTVNVYGQQVVNVSCPTTQGTLRFIEIIERAKDTQTDYGPSIVNTAIYLNWNECLVDNGGCVQRACLDQLNGPPICGNCSTGYEIVNLTHCQKVDPCTLPIPCGPNANCTSGLLPDRNKTCTCRQGYANTTGTCTDINECGAVNGNCTNAICVDVIGASVSTPICLPLPLNCSLALGSVNRNCNLTLTDNAAGHNITFLFMANLSPLVTLNGNISFGPPNDPKRFKCSLSAISGSMAQCTPPAGVFGTNLAFTMSLCAIGQCWDREFRFAGAFHHPPPKFTPSTIRFSGGANSAAVTAPSNLGGDVVVFSGTNFLSGSFASLPSYKVRYRSGSVTKPCAIVASTTTTTQLTCTTVQGSGNNFRFDILIDNVTVETSTDTFSYPTTPVISSVTGCPINNVTTTSECPTASNNTVLTIQGTDFTNGNGFVAVGGLSCQPITFTSSSYITCTLPEGVGLELPVIVSSGIYLSIPAFSVSYARPVISSVSGCPNTDITGTSDCDRAGTSVLTITGSNFGFSEPTVYLGSSSGPQCTNVTLVVAHTQITCVLPRVQGPSSDAFAVVVQQFNGQVSLLPSPTVTYRQCEAGQANDLENCDPCPAGKYSAAGQGCGNCDGGYIPNNISAATDCVICSAGTAAVPGDSECSLCAAGKFAAQDGSSACINCPAGSFARSTISCGLCIQGTYQGVEGQTSCLNCTIGKFASFYGSTACTKCPPGKYTDIVQALSCSPCDYGYVQPSFEQTSCSACPIGRQAGERGLAECDDCVRGRFTDQNGTEQCQLCAAGFFQSDIGQTTCGACPAGTQAPGIGSPGCTNCPSGTFAINNPLNGTESCTPCSAGYAQPAASQSTCERCAAGTFSEQEADTCVPCQAGSYSASGGASACAQCPLGAKPDPKLADCLCPVGMFSEPIPNTTQILCNNCPAGAVCTTPGVTLAGLLTAPGWWRAPNTLRFYPCRFPELCLGGLGNVCEFARQGALCSVCVAGYSSNGAGKPCSLCPSRNAAWGETVGIMLLILAIIIILMLCMLAYSNMQQRALIALTKANDVKALADMQATLKEYELGDEYFEQVRRANREKELGESDKETYEEEEEETGAKKELPSSSSLQLPPVTPHAPHAEFEEGGWVSNFRTTYKATMKKANVSGILDAFVAQSTQQLKNKLRRAPNFIYKVKILLGFFQVATIMPLNGAVNWPLYWTRFIAAFSFFNFDFIPWSSLGCAASISYLDKALIIGCVPIAAVILIAVVVFLWDKSTYKYSLETQLEIQMHQQQVWRQFTKLVLFTVFLLYPFSSKITLGVYNCVTVEGQTYVAADFTLNCTDEYYTRTAGVNVIFVLLYPIGVPLACFYILYRNLHRLREPEVVLQFGFLYDAYTDDRWYWEMFDMTHKLCLTSITLFLPTKAVMPTNMCIIVLYFIGLVLANPYIRKGDDRFHLLVQVNLYLLALIGLILITIDHPYLTELADEETMVVLLSALLICMNLGLFIGFAIIAGRNAIKIIRGNRRAKPQTSSSSPIDGSVAEQLP